jgi:hypothetical protein
MIVYHGSTVAVKNPRIIVSELGRDFDPGFYTTDLHAQACRWARRKARIERRAQNTSLGIVSRYILDDEVFAALNFLEFPEPSLAWLDMVCLCRSDASYRHGYDIVAGKIANDAVGETVSYVAQGIMRREDALERLRFEKINNQICLNTEAALAYLHFQDFEEVG